MARESCRNGVEVDLPGQTVGAIQARPEPAQFQFRATTHWISGAHVQTHIQEFRGVEREDISRGTPLSWRGMNS